MTAAQRTNARYYGCCPLTPGTRLTVKKWYRSRGHLVFTEFGDEHDVEWIGPEYPLGEAKAAVTSIETQTIHVTIIATTIDANKGQTDFVVDIMTIGVSAVPPGPAR